MILIDITGKESDELYQELEISNGIRHYDFLRSIVLVAIKANKPFISHQILKALNYHAIACLNNNAGEYRPIEVGVFQTDEQGNKKKTFNPPEQYRVEALMDDFINTVNRYWNETDTLELAAYVLWRICHIHPFNNGNGRTARAACYFVLCVKSGMWLPGKTILPELLRQYHDDYVVALKEVDKSVAQGNLSLQPLQKLLEKLLTEQLASAGITDPEPPAADAPIEPTP